MINRNSVTIVRTTAALWLASLALTCACSKKASDDAHAEDSRRKSAESAKSTVLGAGSEGLLADVAGRALPAVVSVTSTRVARVEVPDLPFGRDPFFRRFFGPDAPFSFPFPRGGERIERGLGSGVIVGKDVILTNAHVVDGAKELEITASNKRSLKAKVVGSDPKSDLAVLRIEGDVSGLTSLAFGDSSKLRLGQMVLAIGNPFGVGQTVTMGIVSATSRADLGIEAYEDFIQTDAAINPGNSGGALVDLDGKLIGIPTAILSRSGGYMGVGFAIPSSMAEPIMKSLIEHGRVDRGFLGVTIQDLDAELAKALGLKKIDGVLIADVSPGGPAAKAGLKRGDVVINIDGKAVQTTGQLRNLIAAAGVGKVVKLDVLRGQSRETVSAKLENQPQDIGTPGDGAGSGGADASAGLVLAPLDGSLRQKLSVPPSVSGVAVIDVRAASPAARAGLRDGDVIVQIGKVPVSNPADVARQWSESKGSLAVLIWRDGHTFYAVLKR